jgi:hypothetical protein
MPCYDGRDEVERKYQKRKAAKGGHLGSNPAAQAEAQVRVASTCGPPGRLNLTISGVLYQS